MDATKRATGHALACTQTCIFCVENVFNALVNCEKTLSGAIHHLANVSLLQEDITPCCDLQRQNTFPLISICLLYYTNSQIRTLSSPVKCAPQTPQIEIFVVPTRQYLRLKLHLIANAVKT